MISSYLVGKGRKLHPDQKLDKGHRLVLDSLVLDREVHNVLVQQETTPTRVHTVTREVELTAQVLVAAWTAHTVPCKSIQFTVILQSEEKQCKFHLNCAGA